MRVMMNYKERTKESIIKECAKGKIRAKDAAQRLKISVRQVENLKKKYREGISLLHGNCGKSTVKALDPALKPIYHLAFMLLYWTGMRSGECLALAPCKINHEKKTIRIYETFKTEEGEDKFDDTKNEVHRDVTLPDFVYDELMAYINRVYGIEDDERIFYFKKGTINRELDYIAKKAGVERIRVHDLRHSHVALLIKLGYRSHAIASRIGDTVTEVDKTYAHLYPDTNQNIAVDLNKHKDGFSF